MAAAGSMISVVSPPYWRCRKLQKHTLFILLLEDTVVIFWLYMLNESQLCRRIWNLPGAWLEVGALMVIPVDLHIVDRGIATSKCVDRRGI